MSSRSGSGERTTSDLSLNQQVIAEFRAGPATTQGRAGRRV